MKKVFLFILLTFIISCTYIQENYAYWYSLPDDSKIPENIKSFKEITNYIYDDKKGIKYKANYGEVATAQETLDRGYGSCVERSLLILALMKKRNHYEGSLAIGDMNNTKTCNHAEAFCQGKTILYKNDNFKIWKIYEWKDIAQFIADYNNVH